MEKRGEADFARPAESQRTQGAGAGLRPQPLGLVLLPEYPEIFGWSAAAAASKEIEKQGHYPKLARLWMGLEHARLLLIAYRPQETDPSKVQPITAEFRRGAGVVAGLQNQLVQQESWNSVDDETIQTGIAGYKVRAYGKR